MRKSWPFGRHKQWRSDVDAFVDGELTGERVSRFEAHLSGCAGCMALVAERGETKRMTMALPDVRALRSFRLTPGMLVEPTVVRESRGTPVLARFAQVTVSIAVVAFAAVVVADLSSGGDVNDATLQSTTGDDDAAPVSAAGDAGGAASAERSSSNLGDTALATTATAPEVGSSVGAASNPSTTPEPRSPEPPATGRDPTVTGDATLDSAYSAPTGKSAADDLSKNFSTEQASDSPATIGDAASVDGDDDSGGRTLLVVEIALAALAAIAGAAWLVLRRRGART